MYVQLLAPEKVVYKRKRKGMKGVKLIMYSIGYKDPLVVLRQRQSEKTDCEISLVAHI